MCVKVPIMHYSSPISNYLSITPSPRGNKTFYSPPHSERVHYIIKPSFKFLFTTSISSQTAASVRQRLKTDVLMTFDLMVVSYHYQDGAVRLIQDAQVKRACEMDEIKDKRRTGRQKNRDKDMHRRRDCRPRLCVMKGRGTSDG